MAVDEAILDRYANAERQPSAPTLRLYGFLPPALSLGRSQDAAGFPHPALLASQGVHLVRRPTGGGAVLHEHERTYAVVGRLREHPFPGGVLDTYRRIASALVAALLRLGLEARAAGPQPRAGGVPRSALCFEEVSQHEIAVGTLKLVGSAQLRRRGAFLQHGSILLRVDPSRAVWLRGRDAEASGRFAGIEDVLGRRLDPRDIDDALLRGFESVFHVALDPGELSADEATRARSLENTKYRSSGWTLEGRSTMTSGAR